MLTDLIHRIGIAAPAETIYRALTTEEGIRARWTTNFRIPTGFKSFSPALPIRAGQARNGYAGSSSKTIFYRNAVASTRRNLIQLLRSRFSFVTRHPA